MTNKINQKKLLMNSFHLQKRNYKDLKTNSEIEKYRFYNDQ